MGGLGRVTGTCVLAVWFRDRCVSLRCMAGGDRLVSNTHWKFELLVRRTGSFVAYIVAGCYYAEVCSRYPCSQRVDIWFALFGAGNECCNAVHSRTE